MKFFSSFLLVAFGYVMRLGAGMAVIVVLARTVGVQEFGYFAFWLTVSTLSSIPANFGFPTLVLQEFGSSFKNAHLVLGEVLSAKLFLSSAVMACALLTRPWLTPESYPILLFLLAAQLADSFTEFYNLGFRRFNKFSEETRTAIFTSVLHMVLVIGAVLTYKTAISASIAFFASRTLALIVVRYRVRKIFSDVSVAPIRAAWLRIKKSWAYAMEVALFTGYNQADAIVINYFLDHASVGLYQAGMKLVEGACRIAPVLAQLLLPKLASEAANQKNFTHVAWRALGIFAAVGIVGGTAMALGASLITHYLFGPEFAPLEALLPLFGMLLLCRYMETATGLLLVACDLQHRKVWLVLGQMTFVLAGGSYAVYTHGLIGWQIVNIAGLLLVTVSYVQLLRTSIKSKHIQKLHPTNNDTP